MTIDFSRMNLKVERLEYSHLSARNSQEDDGYTVQVKLRSELNPSETAWGEEVADSLEEASLLLVRLAARFSIPQHRITLEIRMENLNENTRH